MAVLMALVAATLPVLAISAPASALDVDARAANDDIPWYWEHYAPRVFFDPQERYLPTSVEHIVENSTLNDGGTYHRNLTIDSPELAAASPGHGSHLEIDRAAWGGMEPVSHPDMSDHMLSEAPMYVTQYSNQENGTIEITYWMIYAYNGCTIAEIESKPSWWFFWQDRTHERFEWCPGGTHQADIERVRVEIDATTHAPLTVTYRAHSKETTFPWSDVQKTGSHPHVYPSLNGHANYHREGIHTTMSGSEEDAFAAVYHGAQGVGMWIAGAFVPGAGLAMLAFKTVMGAKMVDVNNASATIASPPDRDRVVWEPWQYGDGLIPIHSGVGIWDFPGRWGPENDNRTLEWLGPKRHNSHIELNAMKWAFEAAMWKEKIHKQWGPDGPLHKTDVTVDDVIAAIAPLAGEVAVALGDEEVCVGESCDVVVDEEPHVQITATYDPERQYVHSWLGECDGEADDTCVIGRDDVRGTKHIGVVIDHIGIAAQGAGPTGTVSVWDQHGDLVCDDVEYCEANGAVGDTFTVEAHIHPHPEIEARFVQWTNGCTGTSTRCEVTIEEPTRVPVDAEVHFPMIVAERELDVTSGYHPRGPGEHDISGVSGDEVLRLGHVSSSGDEAVFEMVSDPMTIRAGTPAGPYMAGYDDYVLDGMELRFAREGIEEGSFDGFTDGEWVRQYADRPGHHNQIRDRAQWDIDGVLDWGDGRMEMDLVGRTYFSEWHTGQWSFDAKWEASHAESNGPGSVEVHRNGERVDVIPPDGVAEFELTSDQVVLTTDRDEVPSSGWALLAVPTSGATFAGWSGDYDGIATATLPTSYNGVSLEAAFQWADVDLGVRSGSDVLGGLPDSWRAVGDWSGFVGIEAHGGTLDAPLRASATFAEQGVTTTQTIEIDELTFGLASDGTVVDAALTGTSTSSWSGEHGSSTVSIGGVDGTYTDGVLRLDLYAAGGDLIARLQLAELAPALKLSTSGPGFLEVWRDGSLDARVGAGSQTLSLRPGDTQIRVTSDRAVAVASPLALFAEVACMCHFEFWSGDHDGATDVDVALRVGEFAEIGASFASDPTRTYSVSERSTLDSPSGEAGPWKPGSEQVEVAIDADGAVEAIAAVDDVFAVTESVVKCFGLCDQLWYLEWHELEIREFSATLGTANHPLDLHVHEFDATFDVVVTFPDLGEDESRNGHEVTVERASIDPASGDIILDLRAQKPGYFIHYALTIVLEQS